MTPFRLALVALLLATTAAADPLRVVSLPTNDLVYDPVTKQIYASVPSSAGSIGNTVTAIDPETGQIGASVPVGSEPGKLVIADQGGTIYASLDGAAAVRRFDTVSGTAGLQFSLGNGYGPNYADDLAVVPGHPERVAISLYNKGISPNGVGVFIFENGTPLPKYVKGVNALAYSDDPTRLYGYDNQSTGFGFLRMHADDSGIPGGTWLILMTGFGVRIQFDGGRVYDTSGGVWDPEAGTLLGHLPGGIIRPDSKLGRVFILQGDGANVQLAAYDASAFNRLWSAPIPDVSGGVGSLIRWGADGLAFRTSGGQVFLLHTGEISVAPPSFSLTLSPTTAIGAATVAGTITLSAPAPSGGAAVSLASSDPAAVMVPPQVVVPAGATTAAFPLVAHLATAAEDVTISATYGSVTHTATLHLAPPSVPVHAHTAQLVLFPNPVPGGLLALGQVILPQPAGASGVAVSLTSSSPAAAPPVSVTILPGASTVTFPIITLPVTAPTLAQVTANCSFGAAMAALQLLPLSSSLPPTPVAANLLVNGSFEAPRVPDGQPYITLSGDALPGWRIVKGTIDVSHEWQPAPDGGTQSLDLVGTPGAGTIEQSFPTEPGQEYVFSGWLSHDYGDNTPEGRADVYLNGAFFTQLYHNLSSSQTNMNWVPFSFPFRATTPQTTLTLTDVTDINPYQGTVLDGLSVTRAEDQNPPVITPAAELPAPSNLTARLVTGQGVQLTWQDNSTDENAFAVWRRTGSSDWMRIGVLAPNTTAFLDPNVAPGTTYTYRVRATRGDVASAWSNEASVTSP